MTAIRRAAAAAVVAAAAFVSGSAGPGAHPSPAGPAGPSLPSVPPPDTGRTQPIVLEHADSLVGLEIAGEPARQLVGGVRFRQGDLVLDCNRAIQYTRTGRVFFEGMVQVRDDSIRLVAQRALYDPATRTVEAFDRVLLEENTTTLQARHGTYSAADRRAHFRGGVIVADTSTVLTAGEVRYDRDRRHLTADSAVRIEDPGNGVVTLSDRFEHDRAAGVGVWTGAPRLLRAEPGRGAGAAPAETLTVTGRIMESREDSLRRLTVRDSVRLFHSGLAGTAGALVFLPANDSIALLGDPYLWYREEAGAENQISGDTVTMILRGGSADRVRVAGNALASSETAAPAPGRFNQLAGQELLLLFDGRRLASIDVRRTATSLYYLFEQGRPNGLNRASGSGVTIRFSDGAVQSITLAENVEGRYVPERLVAGNEEDFNLPGFRWREDRPALPR